MKAEISLELLGEVLRIAKAETEQSIKYIKGLPERGIGVGMEDFLSGQLTEKERLLADIDAQLDGLNAMTYSVVTRPLEGLDEN
ncbi:hypothetical protein HCJ66_11315 [Listeria sp. FSL L7-1582]|uniref:hypothetical protein n=1 Tax=Listeria portnoyi TaxID=2713504 RepID=UPI00164E9DCE|nr:hypothetical protein [Listeria portnoyi]MBC6310126.1 hypothetical protein [Listeria portnoyi]